MLFLDIETLGVESNSVILSIGAIFIDSSSSCSYKSLFDKSIFIKLDAKEQIQQYKRTVSKETITWWEKQSKMARETNYKPSPKDWSTKEGLLTFDKWVDSVSDKDTLCWTRGSLDQVCLDSLYRAAGMIPPIKYNKYRDVRTAIEFLYPDTAKNGYVDVDASVCEGFDRDTILKHSPVHDCVLDAAMMLCGKQ